MKCPECGKEMRNGYLFCSKDVLSALQMRYRVCLRMRKKLTDLLKLPNLNRVTELISPLQFVRIAKL